MANKNIKTQIIFLGTGANGGIPQLDCRCVNCANNKVLRKRSSILIKHSNLKLIIDCGPDFKQQLFDQNLRLQDVSGILLSHLHPDHSTGLVELGSGKKLGVPIMTPAKVKRQLLRQPFFNHLVGKGFTRFKNKIKDIKIKFIEIPHDPSFPTFAIKLSIDNKTILIATDIAEVTDIFIKEAKGADIVVFDGTFLEKSLHHHIAIRQSAPLLRKINKNVVFTHINHSESKRLINIFLRKFNLKLAFDGMQITI